MSESKNLHAKGQSILGITYDDREIPAARAQYIYNFLSLFSHKTPELKTILQKVIREGAGSFLGEAFYTLEQGHKEDMEQLDVKSLNVYLDKKESAINEQAFKTFLEELEQSSATKEEEPDNISHENIEIITKSLMLSDTEKDLLIFIDNISEDYHFNSFLAKYIQKDTKKIPYLLSAMIYGNFEKADEISKSLDNNGTLVKYELITPLMLHKHENEEEFGYEPSFNMHTLTANSNLTKNDIIEKIIGKPTQTDVNLKDFPHLQGQIEKIKNDIETALKDKKTGINIMLYGPAGTGKTTLAAALAADLGIELYSVGEEHNTLELDSDGYEKKSKVADYRRRKLTAAHDLLAGKDALILFDEAEDLTMKGGQKSDVDDKIGTNRLVEENPIVTIYACNDMERFHESFLQRFTHIINVPRTPAAVRKQQWKTQARIHELELDDESLTLLGRKYNIPARMVAHSIETIAKLRPHLNESKEILGDIDEYLRSKGAGVYNDANIVEDAQALPDKFAVDLISTSAQKSINSINEAIQNKQKTTILMHGKPGGGLITATRYIADQMPANLVETSAHEIMNPPPMSSSVGILTQAFAEAANQNALLVIHGVDQFTDDPKESKEFHKSSLLNLVFTKMATHKNPVVLATHNPTAELDDLFKKRFSHTVDFDALNPQQVTEAVQHFFTCALDSTPQSSDIFISDIKQAYNAYQTSGCPDNFDVAQSILDFSQLRKKLTQQNEGIGFHAKLH